MKVSVQERKEKAKTSFDNSMVVHDAFGLTNFANSDFLSDCKLKFPEITTEFPSHKVILASGSKYVYELLKTNSV